MQPINALSLSPDVNRWLANSHHPRILHIFDHACNLINERREVLSIVTPQIGNGPFNLVIPRLRKSFERLPDLETPKQTSEVFSDYLHAQSLISIRDNQLNLGGLTINLAGAKHWTPRPNWEGLHGRRDDITKLLLTNYQKCGLGMGFTTSAELYSTTAFNHNLPLTNYQFSNSLISSLANADLPSSITAAEKLAGLGIGLTPEGDDFIMGALLAAWIIHPPEIANSLAREIAEKAAPLTTSLSVAWLRSAGSGEAGILWHDFFDALSTGSSPIIELQIIKLLSVGETSGVAALAGFFGVFIRLHDDHHFLL